MSWLMNMMVMVAGRYRGMADMAWTPNMCIQLLRAARVIRAEVGNMVVVSRHLCGRGSENAPRLALFSPGDSGLADPHCTFCRRGA
jgi:hypothetical protein